MRRLIVLMVLLSAMAASAAPPDRGQRTPGGRDAAAAPGQLSADQAAAIAQRVSGGRGLSAQLMRREGEPVYRIKVLTPDGVVRVLHIDARTGAAR